MARSFVQLRLDERRKIARRRMAGISMDVIAEKLGRHRSTISREFRRNAFEDRQYPELSGYFCVTAHEISPILTESNRRPRMTSGSGEGVFRDPDR
jgi:transposase, IS30 family